MPPFLRLSSLMISDIPTYKKMDHAHYCPKWPSAWLYVFLPYAPFTQYLATSHPTQKKQKLPSTSTLSVRCSAPAELQSANRWIILCRCDAWLSFASVLDALRTHSLLFIAPKCLSTWWERFSLQADLRVGGGQSSSDGSLLLSCNPSHCCCHVQTGLRPINEHGSRFTLSSALAHLKPRPFLNPGRLQRFTKWVSVVEFRAVRMSPSLPLPTVGVGLTLPPMKAAKSERMGKTLVKQQRLLPSNRCSRCQLRERLARQPRHCSGICKTHVRFNMRRSFLHVPLPTLNSTQLLDNAYSCLFKKEWLFIHPYVLFSLCSSSPFSPPPSLSL